MNHSRFNIILNPKNISINDRGLNYGDGLFETILVRDSKILYLKQHIKRLHQGCDVLSLKKPSLKIINDAIKKVLGVRKDCIVKIILTRGDSMFGYNIPKDIKHNLYFIRKAISKSIKKNELIALKISNYTTYKNSHLAKIKHLNRIDQCLIAEELNNMSHINDLIVLNEKNIVETLSSNIFFVKKIKSNYVFNTPRIDKFGVKGILRDEVISYLKKHNFKIQERNIMPSHLKEYSFSFKVNSIQGLIFIDEIENNKFSRDQILYNVLKKFIY